MGKLTMIKNKMYIVTVATGIVLTLGVWSTNSLNVATSKSETSSSISIQKISGNHALYDSVENLENTADLIIVGKTPKDFEQNQPVIVKDADGYIEDFYTPTPFEVRKVLKGVNVYNQIVVIQPAVIVEQPGKQEKTMWLQEDYSLLKKSSSYLLFLKQINEGSYSIIAVNQGKFNLDKMDQEEQKVEKQSLQYSNLKAKVLEKYKDIVGNQ